MTANESFRSLLARLDFRLRQVIMSYGRYPVLLFFLSVLFFSVEHSTQPITPQRLFMAIDENIRSLVLESGGTKEVNREIDETIRTLAYPPDVLMQWAAAYWDWLWRWDGIRRQAYKRVLWTVLLAMAILGLFLAAFLWSRSGMCQAMGHWSGRLFDLLLRRLPWPLQALKRWFTPRSKEWLARWGFYLLGAFPAYALVFVLADILKHLKMGDWPVQVFAVLAIAVGDGVLVSNLDNFQEARQRLAQRDFMASVRSRLSAEGVNRYLTRLVMIDCIPYSVIRLSVMVGTIVVVGIVPGLYRGTLGGLLNLQDPNIWLQNSLDGLWGLAVAMVLFTVLSDRLSARFQKDQKGIDRLSQIFGHVKPIHLSRTKTLAKMAALMVCVVIISGIHWQATFMDVLLRLALSLGEVLIGGTLGLGLAVGVGILLPLYSEAMSGLTLQFFEAIPRVIGVAFFMTAFNLGVPETTSGERYLVWSLLLGLFSFAEIARGLFSQVVFLQRVDFVNGLRALGLRPWRIFGLHIWPQMKYRVYASIYPLIRAIIFCEGAISILRFAMQGVVIRLFPIGSLLAEGAERFSFDELEGVTYGLAVIVLMATCIEVGSQTIQYLWNRIFLKHPEM